MLAVLVATAALLGVNVPAGVPSPAMAALADGAAVARARYLEGDFAGAARAADDVDKVFIGACADGDTAEGCAAGLAAGPAFFADGAAWDAWADAQATKALALYRQGDDVGGDAVFASVIITRPVWMPDRGFVPPKPLARFDALRDRLLAGKTVPVTLRQEGDGDAVIDGRLVTTGSPIDVLPGNHYVGVVGLGRVVEVSAAMDLAVGRRRAGTSPSSTTTVSDSGGDTIGSEPVESVVEEDGAPWGIIAAVTVGVVVVAGGGIAAVLLLQQPEASPNPGGTTVSFDASILKR